MEQGGVNRGTGNTPESSDTPCLSVVESWNMGYRTRLNLQTARIILIIFLLLPIAVFIILMASDDPTHVGYTDTNRWGQRLDTRSLNNSTKTDPIVTILVIYYLLCSIALFVVCAALAEDNPVHHFRTKPRTKMPKGRLGHCVKCGYDIRANTFHCSECGHPFAIPWVKIFRRSASAVGNSL